MDFDAGRSWSGPVIVRREGEYGGADVAERRLIMGANLFPLEKGHNAFASRATAGWKDGFKSRSREGSVILRREATGSRSCGGPEVLMSYSPEKRCAGRRISCFVESWQAWIFCQQQTGSRNCYKAECGDYTTPIAQA